MMGTITGIVGLVIGLAVCVLMIIAMWKIFTKAGEKGWKSIIPIYNGYTIYKFSWKPLWFWITLAIGILFNIIIRITGVESKVGLVFFAIFLIAEIVIAIISMYKLSKSFGHGVGFTIGLILLAPIFILILAFGSSQYIGPEGKAQGTITE